MYLCLVPVLLAEASKDKHVQDRHSNNGWENCLLLRGLNFYAYLSDFRVAESEIISGSKIHFGGHKQRLRINQKNIMKID